MFFPHAYSVRKKTTIYKAYTFYQVITGKLHTK